MESIRNIYKIGHGPSSSHTMGPQIAAERFLEKHPEASYFKVELFGSLALTGKGHLTDQVILETLEHNKTEVIFNYHDSYDYHPNGLNFKAYNNYNQLIDEWLVFSVGGGELKELNAPRDIASDEIYQEKTMSDILGYCQKNDCTLLEYINTHEDETINEYLLKVWHTMEKSIIDGMNHSGTLPGALAVKRKASDFKKKFEEKKQKEILIYAASLAVAEENASGGVVVTSPTCGSAGVLPSVLYYAYKLENKKEQEIVDALKIAGLIGLLAKNNASISGAEVGCQGEIGVACSMASAAYAFLNGGSNLIIEYAAEIALEHHLGLTCDPVNGEVQIPCIERNAIASTKAIDASKYALLTDGEHFISLDKIFITMKKTGLDLSNKYKETSTGGLALKE